MVVLKTGMHMPINIGQAVRICAECEWAGLHGAYVEFDEHHEDGDFYGVEFENEPGNVVFFWRKDLLIVAHFS